MPRRLRSRNTPPDDSVDSQRRTEVSGRQPARVEGRDHLTDLRRPPRIGGQDPRAELLCPPASSTRLSLTRGARTAIVPDPIVTRRSRARPLWTTSRCPSLNRSTYSSAYAFSATALIRRAPSLASSSSASVSSSLPSRQGACDHRSWRAFLPAITGFGLQQPGRYGAFLLRRIHNSWV
jgi:hypothetical protein